MKKCLFCAEEIQDEARKCRHCGEFIEAATGPVIKPGDLIGPYRIEKELGRGGMGTVYLAEDKALTRKVALKILPASLAHDPDLAKRFKKEAQIAAGLIHPNIISVFAVGETATGQPYYAMTLLSGGALTDRLRTGPIPFVEALRLTQDILAGLGFAHAKDVIHRDIKPGNILFTENGSAVIVDFGIAHASMGTRVETISGSLIGTPHFMSPEQWNGKAVDRRSDLYAVGAMLYQMLTGQLPFTGQDVNSIMCGHLLQPVAAPSTLIPALPATLDAIVLKALAKEPESRFQSAEEFHQAIENEMGISGRTPLPKPSGRPVADLGRTLPLSSPIPSTPVDSRQTGTGSQFPIADGSTVPKAAAVPSKPVFAPNPVASPLQGRESGAHGAANAGAGPWYDHPWVMFAVGGLCIPLSIALYLQVFPGAGSSTGDGKPALVASGTAVAPGGGVPPAENPMATTPAALPTPLPAPLPATPSVLPAVTPLPASFVSPLSPPVATPAELALPASFAATPGPASSAVASEVSVPAASGAVRPKAWQTITPDSASPQKAPASLPGSLLKIIRDLNDESGLASETAPSDPGQDANDEESSSSDSDETSESGEE